MRPILIASMISMLLPLGAQAQPAKGDSKVEVRKLVLGPSAEPVPALRYVLLPPARALKPGNAALLYQRAHSPEWWPPQITDVFKSEWMERPLSEFPKAEADKILSHRGLFAELDLAARRVFCDWEMHERLRSDGVHLLLPDVQSFRRYGTLLAIRSRRHLAEDRYDEAAYSLQSGFALSVHVAEAPTLINLLVGVAIAAQSAAVVEEWIGRPESPNLYWALTNLPPTVLSMRRGLDSERMMLDSIFPGAREALEDPKRLFVKPADKNLVDTLNLFDAGLQKNVLIEWWIQLRLQPEARSYLMSRGRTAAQVDALGAENAAILYMLANYDRVFDDMTKYISLPPSQALPLIQKAQKDLRAKQKQQPEAYALAHAAPAIASVYSSVLQFDRKLALLRTLEALRLHLGQDAMKVEAEAKNVAGGKFPAKLEDITIVPVPTDPLTDRPFPYRLEGGRAVLTLSPTPGRSSQPEVRYEITIAPRGGKQ